MTGLTSVSIEKVEFQTNSITEQVTHQAQHPQVLK